MDLFFDNDNARIEQIIEYSPMLSGVMSKIVKRKANSNIFRFFPQEEPIAYLSYHFNTEETLKNYPLLMEQMLSELPVDSEDTDIVLDLVSTLIDEKATATMFDGDLSLFFHAIEAHQYTYMGIEYDEDYEEVEVEKTIDQTKPIFTIVFTSSHPTLGNKLLRLAERKSALVKEGDYYYIQMPEDIGELILFKKGDVIVITNGLQYLSEGTISPFANKVKREVSKNYFVGNFEIKKIINNYIETQDLGDRTVKVQKIASQFDTIKFKSSKKMTDNKMKFVLQLNSNHDETNIITQVLDLILNFN